MDQADVTIAVSPDAEGFYQYKTEVIYTCLGDRRTETGSKHVTSVCGGEGSWSAKQFTCKGETVYNDTILLSV